MKLTEKQLKERWETDEGKNLSKEIIAAIKKQKNLNAVKGIEKIEGRFDLRGISFPKEIIGEIVVGSLKFKKITLENIDFSLADIENTTWKNCWFKNIIFRKVNARELECINCDFEDIVFENSYLSYSYLNIRHGKNSGTFSNVKFLKTHLNETRFSFPKFENCVFQDCNLYGADFDGSRFENCQFIGRVNSPIFKKHSQNEYMPDLFFNRVDKKKFSNDMKNIDFKMAKLEYVCISKDLDLSGCHFPEHISINEFINNQLYINFE